MADTPGLDAMAQKQRTPIRAETPGLDAMAAKQNNGRSLLEDAAEKERAKMEAAAQRSQENKAQARANREARKLERGLKRAEITGRVNNFVRDWAAQNAAVNRAVNIRGQTIDTVQLPGVGALDVSSGKLVRGPLFEAPTSSVELPTPSTDNCVGLALSIRNGSAWVGPGSIAGRTPSQWQGGGNNSTGASAGGGGLVYAWVEIDQETGQIDDVGVDSTSGRLPEPTDTTNYIALGTVIDGTVTNYDCGSVYAEVCRNWFASKAPFYGVNLHRCGCNSYY